MSKPSCRELLSDTAAIAGTGRYGAAGKLIARVERVLALHRAAREEIGLPPKAQPYCFDCKRPWPCPTVRLLNGEEP